MIKYFSDSNKIKLIGLPILLGITIFCSGFFRDPYTGKIYERYANGNKKSERFYTQGKLNGIQTNYYLSGNVKSVECYKYSKLDGLQKYYYASPSGNIQLEINYKDGAKLGLCTWRFPNGKIHIKTSYNGKINEKSTWTQGEKEKQCWDTFYYHLPGIYTDSKGVTQDCAEVISKNVYNLNQRYYYVFPLFFPDDYGVSGNLTIWLNNGQKEYEANYNDTKLIGDKKVWHNNGQLYYHIKYDNQGKAIYKTYYSPKGIKTSETYPYKNNPIGRAKYWNKDGVLTDESYIEKDMFKEVYYYEKTNLKKLKKITYYDKNSDLLSLEEAYYPSGNLKSVSKVYKLKFSEKKNIENLIQRDNKNVYIATKNVFYEKRITKGYDDKGKPLIELYEMSIGKDAPAKGAWIIYPTANQKIQVDLNNNEISYFAYDQLISKIEIKGYYCYLGGWSFSLDGLAKKFINDTRLEAEVPFKNAMPQGLAKFLTENREYFTIDLQYDTQKKAFVGLPKEKEEILRYFYFVYNYVRNTRQLFK